MMDVSTFPFQGSPESLVGRESGITEGQPFLGHRNNSVRLLPWRITKRDLKKSPA